MLQEESLKKASEDYINELYYFRMGNSDACWKGDPRVVAKELGKLKSEAAKYHAIKENIMIRVKGYGWEWCKHPWSKNGHKYTVAELASHLRYIIKEEKKQSFHQNLHSTFHKGRI